MKLGELIDLLKTMPQDKNVYFDILGLAPTTFASYRGYYEDLALGFDGSYGASMKVADLLKLCLDALGKTFKGWKGGDYVATPATRVWIANKDNTTDTLIAGVVYEPGDWCVRLQTLKTD